MGFVKAYKVKATGETAIVEFAINKNIKLTNDQFIALMLHEMIHVAIIMSGDIMENHGTKFHTMRKALERKSGLEIPETEDSKNLEVFDKGAKKQYFCILIENTADGKNFAQLITVKPMGNIIDEIITGHRTSIFTTEKDILDRGIANIAGRVSPKRVRYGIVNTYLHKKIKATRSKNISLSSISDADATHLSEELDKNLVFKTVGK